MKNATKLLCVTMLIGGMHESQAIEGGFDLVGERWEHAVRIESPDGSCSATIVAPNYAITAAHCVESGHWTAKVLRGDASEEQIGTATVAFVDPRYSAADANYDVAVLLVSTNAREPNTANRVALQSSRTYLEMLNAKSPYRTGLAIGHGSDERNQIGTRKGALVANLTPNVGREEMLWSSHRPMEGATRPGDSGGGIYMIVNSQVELAAVTSGSNLITYTIEGDSFASTIQRYAPVAPSLCRAPLDIRSALSFDASECGNIETTRSELATDFSDASLPLLLHMLRLLESSPQIAMTGNDYFLEELALRALILGSRSNDVVDLVINYLDRWVDTDSRWEENVRTLGRALVDQGEMGVGRSTAPPRTNEIVTFLRANQDDWELRAAAKYRESRASSSCPFDNCFLRNEALSMYISQGSGDWTVILPAIPTSEQFAAPQGLEEASHLVCRLARYALLRDESLVSDLLAGGISRSKISTFDSPSLRGISVSDQDVRFSAELSNGSRLEITIDKIQMDADDQVEFSRRLVSFGYGMRDSWTNDPLVLMAKKDNTHQVFFDRSINNPHIFFRSSVADVMSTPEFGIWMCDEIQ